MPDDRLAICGVSDIGQRRTNNEDCHAWWTPDVEEVRRRRGVLLVVADGMGGALAGEKASRMAVETLLNEYRNGSNGDALEDLARAVETANTRIHEESLADTANTGMGTTCTAVVVRDRDVLIAHVGDSRAYLIRGGSIRQLTSDHSLVAHLIERGQLTQDEARVDPRRNVVTRSVGVAPYVEVDSLEYSALLVPGDTLLICSDGLHGVLEDGDIAQIVSTAAMDQACAALIELANQRGGPDNITVLLARLEAAAA